MNPTVLGVIMPRVRGGGSRGLKALGSTLHERSLLLSSLI